MLFTFWHHDHFTCCHPYGSLVMALFRSRRTHQWLLLAVLVWYLLAKVSEVYDLSVFRITGEMVSGHTVKHILAAAGCYSILVMLQRRKLKH